MLPREAAGELYDRRGEGGASRNLPPRSGPRRERGAGALPFEEEYPFFREPLIGGEAVLARKSCRYFATNVDCLEATFSDRDHRELNDYQLMPVGPPAAAVTGERTMAAMLAAVRALKRQRAALD